jgi:hypothetical protein
MKQQNETYETMHKIYFLMNLFKGSKKATLLLIAFLSFTILGLGQDRRLVYAVKNDGKQVGTMTVNETKAGTKRNLKLYSDIKTTFLFTFAAKAIEEAEYLNGKLMNSYIFQTLNGSEKVNTKTRFVNNSYMVFSGGSERRIPASAIYYNMVCLYTQEPVSVNQVYSDKFQKFLPIQRLGKQHYKIDFPDGNSNQYYYQNGICRRIESNYTLFPVVMELK